MDLLPQIAWQIAQHLRAVKGTFARPEMEIVVTDALGQMSGQLTLTHEMVETYHALAKLLALLGQVLNDLLYTAPNTNNQQPSADGAVEV